MKYNILDIPEGVSGKCRITHRPVAKGTEMPTSSFRTLIFGGTSGNGPVVYKKDTVIHELSEDDQGVWMTDMPIELAQMNDCLKGMKGHVLVGGLGLGVAATMLAKRKGIQSVTVVEQSQDVINLVKPYTLRDTDDKYKVSIFQGDLFSHLRDLKGGGNGYDYAFYDIWQSDGESTLHNVVIPLHELSVGVVVPGKNRVRCWNEDVMRGQLANGLRSRLLQFVPNEIFPKASDTTDFDVRAHLLGQTDDAGSKWVQWSLPFFQWVETLPEDRKLEQALAIAPLYASQFGLPGWQAKWEKMT